MPLLWQVSSFIATVDTLFDSGLPPQVQNYQLPFQNLSWYWGCGRRRDQIWLNLINCSFCYKSLTLFGNWTTVIVICPSCGGWFCFQGTLAQQALVLSLKLTWCTVLSAPWYFQFHWNNGILAGRWKLREGKNNTRAEIMRERHYDVETGGNNIDLALQDKLIAGQRQMI